MANRLIIEILQIIIEGIQILIEAEGVTIKIITNQIFLKIIKKNNGKQ